MNIIITAVSEALLWSIMAIGVYLMYKILDIADLSAEGVYPLGGAVCATLIVSGNKVDLVTIITIGIIVSIATGAILFVGNKKWYVILMAMIIVALLSVGIIMIFGMNPLIATIIAAIAGMNAGLVASIWHTKLKIPALLSGILIMTGLYSVNLRVMGKANISMSNTLLTTIEKVIPSEFTAMFIGVIALAIVITGLYLFYKTEIGLSFIATGDNETMSQANSINTDNMKILGYMLSNGLIALSGALLAQFNGYADASSGIGTIVIGLAAVIIAGVIVRNARFALRLLSVVVGAILYRLVIAGVLELNILATDLKIMSAIILTLFLYLPNVKFKKAKVKSKEV